MQVEFHHEMGFSRDVNSYRGGHPAGKFRPSDMFASGHFILPQGRLGPKHVIGAQLVLTKTSAGHWSSVTCQVRSGLYLSTFWAILRVSGPKSFSYTTPS